MGLFSHEIYCGSWQSKKETWHVWIRCQRHLTKYWFWNKFCVTVDQFQLLWPAWPIYENKVPHFCHIIYVANTTGKLQSHFAWVLRPLSRSLTLQNHGYKWTKAEGLRWGGGGRGGVVAPTEASAEAEARARAEEWRGSHSEADSKGKKETFFLIPLAKRLNRNFLLSGAMQGPHHFLCFALMCLQREEGRLNTALLRARKHSSATFSWLCFAVDLCGRDIEPEKQQPPPTVSHSRHAFREGILTSHQVPARGLVLRIMVLQWSPIVFLPWVWAIVHFYIIWRWDAYRCLCFCAQLWWTRKRLERFIGAGSLQVSFNVH